MTRITIDDELRAKLLNFREDLELCDQYGLVVARVQRSTPWTDPDNWTQLTPELTDEEWGVIRRSDNPGITTKELLDHLKGLG
jgi:hypothetical protein